MNCHLDHHPIVGLMGFFLFGLLGSLHCVGMCAPLATLFMGRSPSLKKVLVQLGSYQLARILSYALLGAVLGGLGLQLRAQQWLQWPIRAMAILFAWYALGLPLPRLNFLSRGLSFMLAPLRHHPTAQAAATGILTPLLPCGLLYAAVAAALGATSPARGALYMTVFGLGTLPLLLLGQVGLGSLLKGVRGARQQTILRVLAAISCGVLLWMVH